jgi:hypothetical protein
VDETELLDRRAELAALSYGMDVIDALGEARSSRGSSIDRLAASLA